MCNVIMLHLTLFLRETKNHIASQHQCRIDTHRVYKVSKLMPNSRKLMLHVIVVLRETKNHIAVVRVSYCPLYI